MDELSLFEIPNCDISVKMGSVVSTVEEIEENELLKRFASADPISDNDPFWNKLFSFNFNVDQLNRLVSV